MKRFYHYEHRTASLRELFIRVLRRRPLHTRRARFLLDDFSFVVQHGEAVALIGPNGSGKTTVLRLIAGIYPSTEGMIWTHGRMTAVIEMGIGFHPELTGAENVHLYGAMIGLTRRELLMRYPRIVEFADIGEFLHEPVKYYSSGMKARLAFAVASCVDPDVLLLDEVLAVGDQSFTERCLEYLRDFRASGGTLVAVSHDLDRVSELCSRAIWLERGRVRMDGDVHAVIGSYRSSLVQEAAALDT